MYIYMHMIHPFRGRVTLWRAETKSWRFQRSVDQNASSGTFSNSRPLAFAGLLA